MKLVQASEVNVELEQLPVACEVPLFIEASGSADVDNYTEVKERKAIMVGDSVVSAPTKKYVLVQHAEALRPVINGLTVTGNHDFQFSFWATKKQAHMSVFVGRGFDTVQYGFKVVNSFDGSTSLRYSFHSFRRTRTIEIVGYRLACSNGMKVRVPLDQAEFVKAEERVKIEALLSKSLRLVHMGKVKDDLEQSQAIVEAFALLRNPLQRIIEAAQNVSLEDKKIAEDFVAKYVGKRAKRKVLDQFVSEEKNLWGLYNALTAVATHKTSTETRREALINRAADMLEAELAPQAE